MRILVVGATGMLGQPVVRRLLADGYQVRALARNVAAARTLLGTQVEIVAGDVLQPDSLLSAMAQCDVVYASLRGGDSLASCDRVERGGMQNIATAALRSGVRRLACLSGSGIGEFPTDSPIIAIKTAVVAAVMSSGVEFTIFKPTHFMESLPQFIQRGRAIVPGHQPHKYHYLAAADYAGLVSRSFRTPTAANQSLTIFGPEAFTMAEALQQYCDAVLPGQRVRSAPLAMLRTIGWLTGKKELRFVATLFEEFSRYGEHGNPGVTEQLFGAPPTTLQQWCAQLQAARDGEQQ